MQVTLLLKRLNPEPTLHVRHCRSVRGVPPRWHSDNIITDGSELSHWRRWSDLHRAYATVVVTPFVTANSSVSQLQCKSHMDVMELAVSAKRYIKIDHGRVVETLWTGTWLVPSSTTCLDKAFPELSCFPHSLKPNTETPLPDRPSPPPFKLLRDYHSGSTYTFQTAPHKVHKSNIRFIFRHKVNRTNITPTPEVRAFSAHLLVITEIYKARWSGDIEWCDVYTTLGANRTADSKVKWGHTYILQVQVLVFFSKQKRTPYVANRPALLPVCLWATVGDWNVCQIFMKFGTGIFHAGEKFYVVILSNLYSSSKTQMATFRRSCWVTWVSCKPAHWQSRVT
jgi:hypothetical protein